METLEYILSVIICLPIWGGLIYLLTVTLDLICEWFETLRLGESNLPSLLLGPIYFAVICIIPCITIALGLMAWFLVTSLFGLSTI